MKTDHSKLSIQVVGISDIPVLVEYRLAYLRELQGHKTKSDGQQLKEGLSAYFKDALTHGRFYALMAKSGEKNLAFGGMVIQEIPGDFVKSSYLEGDILNMYTVPEARGQGISTLILEKLLEEAKRLGISKLALHTTKNGEKLYRNFGFSEPRFPYLELVLSTESFTCNHE